MRCRRCNETPIRRTMRFPTPPNAPEKKRNATSPSRGYNFMDEKVHGTTGPALVLRSQYPRVSASSPRHGLVIENEALFRPVVFGPVAFCLVSFPFRGQIARTRTRSAFGAIDNGIPHPGGLRRRNRRDRSGHRRRRRNAVTDGIAGIFEGIALKRTTATKTLMRRTISGPLSERWPVAF